MEKYNETKTILDIFNTKVIIFGIILLIVTNIKKIKDIRPVIFIVVSAAVVGIIFKFV